MTMLLFYDTQDMMKVHTLFFLKINLNESIDKTI